MFLGSPVLQGGEDPAQLDKLLTETAPAVLPVFSPYQTRPAQYIQVFDNVTVTTVHRVTAPGTHVLKFWMVDPTVVLQNLVIDTGGLEPSYLGPPESLRLD